MRNVRILLLLILSLTLAWTFAGSSKPAVSPDGADAVLNPGADPAETIDPLILLEGRDALADAVAKSGDPTCIFPNCQPGPDCKRKCRSAYYACLGYCPSASICRSLFADCLACCG